MDKYDKLGVQYSVEFDGETVRIEMPRWEALEIAQILRAGAAEHASSRKASARVRGIAAKIVKVTRPKREKLSLPGRKARYSVERPPSAYVSEVDMDHVLHGSAPYPVLSERDMRTVYPQLEAKELSAPEIGARLYVHERTIYRWRKAAERAKEEGETWHDSETPNSRPATS